MPVFTGLSGENRDRLAALGTNVVLAAGDWLLREGDEADVMYVIRSGRLDVLVEGPPETLVRTLRRGDVVGELALLHAGRRTASVRARRTPSCSSCRARSSRSSCAGSRASPSA